jgi:DNA-binding XRE family transcriptional regulator
VTSGEIKALRARASITQGELAGFFGIVPTTVYKWERGVNRPNDWQVAMLDAFAEAEDKAPGVLRKAVKVLYAQGYARALYLILAAATMENA